MAGVPRGLGLNAVRTGLVATFALLMLAPAWAADAAFRVTHYEARLEPDLEKRSLQATERIDLVAQRAGVTRLEFDAGALDIDEVRVAGQLPTAHARDGSRLVITLAEPLQPGVSSSVQLRYHGQPRHGLEFHPEQAQLYTIFSTSQWLVCLDDPSVRATLDLRVLLPAGWNATGSGVAADPQPQAEGRALFRWQQKQPVPSFTYGFAAGAWREFREDKGGLKLRYLSRQRNAEELARVFGDSADMLGFMGRAAGVPYDGTYEQALVTSTIGQEAAGFAMLSEEYAERVLADPSAEGLIAHEIAHQWWGVMVTCTDWGHFWLNEGFAVFMAAAYLEHRFGRDAYERAVNAWQARVERLVTEHKDHALVYEHWNRPSADDRAVVYVKGAWVLHRLREELGEAAFWEAIRAYTRRFRGQSVTTADFQEAVERSSGRDLRAFFDRWVYARPG